jgi:predicted O-methyltransferase YrrM
MMVETGVADGYSTAVALEAMSANQIGELHSFDIRDDVGVLAEKRDRWTLHLINERNAIRHLRREVAKLGCLDIFFHDSDHWYINQAEEYELGLTSLCPQGYLVSDDVDFSYAYYDFMMERQLPSAVLLDSVKCSAFARLV